MLVNNPIELVLKPEMLDQLAGKSDAAIGAALGSVVRGLASRNDADMQAAIAAFEEVKDEWTDLELGRRHLTDEQQARKAELDAVVARFDAVHERHSEWLRSS